LLARPGIILHAQADDMNSQLLGFSVELLGKLTRRPAARLFAIGEHDDNPRFVPKIEDIGRLFHGRCQRCTPGRHQTIHRAEDEVGSVRRRREIELDIAPVVRPRTKGDETRRRVILGKTLANADRTLSMRLTVLALSLPYPHPSPAIEPDASNTIMASATQEWTFDSSAPAAKTLQAKTSAKAILSGRRNNVDHLCGERSICADDLLLRRQQADTFHEGSCIPIIRLAADLTGLQFEDARTPHRRKTLASGRHPWEVAFMCA
jgi:hypothetical protein